MPNDENSIIFANRLDKYYELKFNSYYQQKERKFDKNKSDKNYIVY